MKKIFSVLAVSCLVFSNFFCPSISSASINKNLPVTASTNKPFVPPMPPVINAKAYILIDTNSGKIIAEKNSEQKLPPASLTKIMTLYIISQALQNQQIKLGDQIRISQNAWKTNGSRMFVKEGEYVSIENLLKGIIVDSGNDACVALAEHLSGGEAGFAEIMNQQAQLLGLKNSHFTDSTGLPHPALYTTAKDLAILSRALINNFPEYYHWYKEKWFTYNGIRQPNRNRLLWRSNLQVDGIKTGHTDKAGFCLVSSAKRNNMRLLSVVIGAPNDTARTDDSEKLLNYGFRFYETRALYKKEQQIMEVRIYKGSKQSLPVGLANDQFITIPSGQFHQIQIASKINKNLIAPVHKGERVGELIIQFNNELVESQPIYALTTIKKGGFFARMKDSVRLLFAHWFA